MTKGLGQLRVFWVEDAHAIVELYRSTIEAAGLSGQMDIEFFADGDLAWQALAKEKPELLVTDIEHDGLDGASMLERLEAKKVVYPILVVSGCNGEIVKGFAEVRCPSLKITVLTKPIDVTKLIGFLSSQIKNLEA